MRILAIDPGISNGLAVFNDDDGKPKYITTVTKDPFEVFNLFIPDYKPDQIVIEAFQAQQISGYGLHTVRMVGGVQALSHVMNIPITTQMPQFRKGLVNYAKMMIDKQQAGWVIHQADALAHLLAFQYKKGWLKILKGDHLTYKDVEIL